MLFYSNGELIEINRKDFNSDVNYYKAICKLKNIIFYSKFNKQDIIAWIR